MLTRVILFCTVFFQMVACYEKEAQPAQGIGDKGKKVAKVYDREIYASQLSAYSRADSARMVQNYIDKITLEEAVVRKAKGSGYLNMGEIEDKTTQFRNSLIALQFQHEYIKHNLDTVVTEESIKSYYDQNGGSFVLNNDIFKGYYIKLPANTPKVANLKAWMASDKSADFQEIKSYCLRYANIFNINTGEWGVFPKHLIEKLNIHSGNVGFYVHNHQVLAYEKEEELFLVRLFDYKFAKQRSPIEYSHEEIRHILLNKRKMQLIGQLNEQLLNEAKSNHNVEIY